MNRRSTLVSAIAALTVMLATGCASQSRVSPGAIGECCCCCCCCDPNCVPGCCPECPPDCKPNDDCKPAAGCCDEDCCAKAE